MKLDIMSAGRIQRRADDLVSLAARAAVHAHLAYDRYLDTQSPDPAFEALGTYRRKLVQLGHVAADLTRLIEEIVGEPVGDKPEPMNQADAVPPPTDPYISLVTETRRAGEITNARAQKLLGIDAKQARKLIRRMEREGVVYKASCKLYRAGQSTDPEP